MSHPDSTGSANRPSHRRSVVHRAWAGGLLACAALLLSSPARAAETIKVGEPFPDLARFELEGTVPDLKGKVVLVDFWASWCGPCKKSFPVMAEIQKEFASRGFAVVAVSVDEKRPAMDEFVKKAQPPFTVLRDAKGKVAEATGVDKMPTSFLLGPDGRVVSVHSGFEGESTRKQYRNDIEAALKAAGK